MKSLDAELIRRSLVDATTARLGSFEVFAEIDSTNSYLMQQAAVAPGKVRVAATNNQTAGRGRHGRTWQSPPGSGLCLSVAYTFASQPTDLAALTLAIGISAVDALRGLKIAGVRLKWPNDLIYKNRKLGGILTEAQSQRGGAVMVVTGIGLNIDISKQQPVLRDSGWSGGIVDLKSSFPALPSVNLIAARLVSALSETFVAYEVDGFAPFLERWREHDWLLGRELTVETPQHILTGVGAGIGDDGALLLDSPEKGRQRIRSGSVLTANVGYRD